MPFFELIKIFREKPVLSHLKNVYATVAAGVGVATLGAMIHLFTNILR